MTVLNTLSCSLSLNSKVIYRFYLCLEFLALIWNYVSFAMKLIVRNIMKCAMKQNNSEATWYFFNLLWELLTKCSLKKKIKVNCFGYFYTSLTSYGEISAFPWKACFPALSKEDAFFSLYINTELESLFGKTHCFSQRLSVLFFRISSVFQICAIQLLAHFTGLLPKEVFPGAPLFLRNRELKMS